MSDTTSKRTRRYPVRDYYIKTRDRGPVAVADYPLDKIERILEKHTAAVGDPGITGASTTAEGFIERLRIEVTIRKLRLGI
jgi:hypothetical protein